LAFLESGVLLLEAEVTGAFSEEAAPEVFKGTVFSKEFPADSFIWLSIGAPQ
jgi:hypothetical protein